MLTITIHRKFSQRRDQTSGIEHIKQRAVGGSRSRWKVIASRISEPSYSDGMYHYTCALTFLKEGGHQNPDLIKREMAGIRTMVEKLGEIQKFQPYPWLISKIEGADNLEAVDASDLDVEASDENVNSFIKVSDSQVHHAMSENTGVTLDEVRERSMPIIDELLNSDEALTASPYFNGIYDRNAQIRSVLSSVKSFLESGGQRRNHVLLWGLPACAKTQILNSVADLLGKDAIVRLDGPSTTSAGIYKTYFKELADIPEPPFVIFEEAEKTSEESLRVWLGALDDRGELRKVNAREMTSRNIKILCLATVNDKDEFDKLMGGTANKPGALSSRFVHQLNCPRPDRKVLKMILERDVMANGGNLKWIEPALQLAEAIETNDPRKVLGFLDGGKRLLDGTYQKDILKIYAKN